MSCAHMCISCALAALGLRCPPRFCGAEDLRGRPHKGSAHVFWHHACLSSATVGCDYWGTVRTGDQCLVTGLLLYKQARSRRRLRGSGGGGRRRSGRQQLVLLHATQRAPPGVCTFSNLSHIHPKTCHLQRAHFPPTRNGVLCLRAHTKRTMTLVPGRRTRTSTYTAWSRPPLSPTRAKEATTMYARACTRVFSRAYPRGWKRALVPTSARRLRTPAHSHRCR
jgi:choline dehydrogenase-like flavoprotein